jgi:hypothetical protein
MEPKHVKDVAPLPWHGVGGGLQASARWCFCDQPSCARRIFTEHLPGVVTPYARRTVRLEEWLRALGFALGGEAGARLVDLKRRQVVDLLPDREAGTLATWLQRPPYVMMVSRDRGANFAA